MNILRKLFNNMYAVGAAVIAALLFYIKLLRSQKKNEQQKRESVERDKEALGEKNKIQTSIEKSRSEVRQEAKKNEQRKRKERQSGKRPSGNVGDRLRNDND